MIPKNKIKVSKKEVEELSKKEYLAIRYENTLKQAVKYNKADLEKVALFINATLDFEFYKEELFNKYPVLRNKLFYFNCNDEYIFFE